MITKAYKVHGAVAEAVTIKAVINGKERDVTAQGVTLELVDPISGKSHTFTVVPDDEAGVAELLAAYPVDADVTLTLSPATGA